MAHSLTSVYLRRSLSNIESRHAYNLTCALETGIKSRTSRVTVWNVAQQWWEFLSALFFCFCREPREAVMNKTCMECHPECQRMNVTATCSAPVRVPQPLNCYRKHPPKNSLRIKEHHEWKVTQHEICFASFSSTNFSISSSFNGTWCNGSHKTCCLLYERCGCAIQLLNCVLFYTHFWGCWK